jgi:GR25 family glycosyltransferase involved in LPS biosynthesis
LGVPESKLQYLCQNGLDPILVKGVNGKLLDDEEISQNTTSWYGMLGPKSAIGCAMSHIKVWKMIKASDDDYGIIMEDDVILEDNFVKKVNDALRNAPPNYDILYLGCFDSTFFTITMGLLGMLNKTKVINKFIKKPGVALGAHAYVVSRKGAKKLINNLDKRVYNHIDYCIQDLASQEKLNVYVATPRIAYQTSTDTCQSTNVKSTHPSLVCKHLEDIYIDKGVRAGYIASLSVIRVGDANLNIMSIMLLLVGIVFTWIGIKSDAITILFVLISYKDIICANIPQSIIWIHYLLIVVPSLLVA